MFSGMAGILITLAKRMKKVNAATDGRLLVLDNAVSPSALAIVTDLERNSKTSGQWPDCKTVVLSLKWWPGYI
jgi:hypothetical protein